MIYFILFSLGFVFAVLISSVDDFLRASVSDRIDWYDFDIKEGTIYKLYPCPVGWQILNDLPNVYWIVKEEDGLAIKTESFADMEQIVIILNSTTLNAKIPSQSDR